jgi:hypothetical protein
MRFVRLPILSQTFYHNIPSQRTEGRQVVNEGENQPAERWTTSWFFPLNPCIFRCLDDCASVSLQDAPKPGAADRSLRPGVQAHRLGLVWGEGPAMQNLFAVGVEPVDLPVLSQDGLAGPPEERRRNQAEQHSQDCHCSPGQVQPGVGSRLRFTGTHVHDDNQTQVIVG